MYGIPVTFGCCVGYSQSQEAWRRYHQSLDVKAEGLKDYFVRDRHWNHRKCGRMTWGNGWKWFKLERIQVFGNVLVVVLSVTIRCKGMQVVWKHVCF